MNDFVYLLSDDREEPYQIGQIVDFQKRNAKFGNLSRHVPDTYGVKVRMLKRLIELDPPTIKQYDLGQKPSSRDNRALYFTNEEMVFSALYLEGRCTVRHRDHISNFDTFKDREDTFHVTYELSSDVGRSPSRSDLIKMDVCRFDYSESAHADLRTEMRLQSFCKGAKKLRGMDIFAGAGGLSIGLDKAGAVETKWAIEFSSAAARAFKSNMPSITVSLRNYFEWKVN
jgi:BAH domain/C-5 cytosine-specific DNA methylase